MTDATPVQKPRKRGVALAVTLVVLALVAFAAAVVWAGGIDAVAELIGLDLDGSTIAVTPQDPAPDSDDASSDDTKTTSGSSGGGSGSTAATSTPSAPASGGDNDADDADGTSGPPAGATIPISAAQAAMYREQLQSQAQITKLVSGDVSAVAIGTSSATSSRASIPLNVSYKSGSPVSGTMVLVNTDGLWYFSSISAGGGGSAVSKPQNVDSGVVHTITEQQADPECQALIEEGLVESGFKTARVDGVTQGAGTATVNVTLLGGSLDRKPARFVLISKTDSGNKYWFLTRFELK